MYGPNSSTYRTHTSIGWARGGGSAVAAGQKLFAAAVGSLVRGCAEEARDPHMASSRRESQGRRPRGRGQVPVSTSPQQQADNLKVAIVGCEQEGRGIEGVGGVGVGARSQEEPYRLHVAILRCSHERRPAVALAQVRIGRGLQEQADDAQVASSRCLCKRPAAGAAVPILTLEP